MTQMNRHQPNRKRIVASEDEDKPDVLLFATMPKKGIRTPKICTYDSIVTQCRLYRAANRIPSAVMTADLHAYVFGELPFISKTKMGNILLQTVIYEPRKLLNNKLTTKPAACYVFKNKIEMQYGLEWMICAWLRHFLNDHGLRDEDVIGPEMMDKELLYLRTIPFSRYIKEFEDRFDGWRIDEPVWPTHLREEIPVSPTSEFGAAVPRALY